MSDTDTILKSLQCQDEFTHYFMENFGDRVESVEKTISVQDLTITKLIKLSAPTQETQDAP